MNAPKLDEAGLRQFGFITGAILVVLFALFFPWFFEMRVMPKWPWIVAVTLWIPALLMPAILRPVYTTWMRAGYVIGNINTRIILGFVYYAMVVPIGVVMRIFGKDPMARKFDVSCKSYRIKSVREPKDRLEKPY